MAQYASRSDAGDGIVRLLADRPWVDYFYGFVAGETSPYAPRLYINTTAIEPAADEKHHVTEEMVDKALAWLRKHQAFSLHKPFFM